MILKQFQEVFDIDNRIVKMHEQLSELYKQRAGILNPDQDLASDLFFVETASDTTGLGSLNSRKIWMIKEYELLQTKWQHYAVKLPKYSALEAKLSSAYNVISTISALLPELHGKMGLLAVPPKKYLDFPVSPGLRLLQNPDIGNDLLSSSLPKTKVSKNWRILVVYSGPSGIYLENPKTIFERKMHLKANFDMSALGLLEYTALTLQNIEIIDSGTWTVLMKDYRGDQLLPYATFKDGRYHFEMDKSDSIYGNIRFRPAVEVG
ncbi:hypothetical protein HYW35_03230 [Candidatus Saccharibacteria bacterium]|nr:hypothetical protein [Candidatus Saccharibacteria bacterium]